MGDVYKARDTRRGRFVALKTLRPELAGSAVARGRFEREAHAISKLSHPHVCAIHDVGQTDSTSFLVMELLDGESLSQRIAKGPLAIGLVAWLAELKAEFTGSRPALTTRLARDYAHAYVWVTSEKAEQALDYQHRPARETLARATRWLLEHGYVPSAVAERVRLELRPV